MSKEARDAYKQKQLHHMRDCIREADRQHTTSEVENAIRRAERDAMHIHSTMRVKQGVLKLK